MKECCPNLQQKIIEAKWLVVKHIYEKKVSISELKPYFDLFDSYPKLCDIKQINKCNRCKYPECKNGKKFDKTYDKLKRNKLLE
jgi:hypothetical protein